MVSGVHGLAWGRDMAAGSCMAAQSCRGCQGRSSGVRLAPGVGAWSAAWESRNRAWVDLGNSMGKG